MHIICKYDSENVNTCNVQELLRKKKVFPGILKKNVSYSDIVETMPIKDHQLTVFKGLPDQNFFSKVYNTR